MLKLLGCSIIEFRALLLALLVINCLSFTANADDQFTLTPYKPTENILKPGQDYLGVAPLVAADFKQPQISGAEEAYQAANKSLGTLSSALSSAQTVCAPNAALNPNDPNANGAGAAALNAAAALLTPVPGSPANTVQTSLDLAHGDIQNAKTAVDQGLAGPAEQLPLFKSLDAAHANFATNDKSVQISAYKDANGNTIQDSELVASSKDAQAAFTKASGLVALCPTNSSNAAAPLLSAYAVLNTAMLTATGPSSNSTNQLSSQCTTALNALTGGTSSPTLPQFPVGSPFKTVDNELITLKDTCALESKAYAQAASNTDGGQKLAGNVPGNPWATTDDDPNPVPLPSAYVVSDSLGSVETVGGLAGRGLAALSQPSPLFQPGAAAGPTSFRALALRPSYPISGLEMENIATGRPLSAMERLTRVLCGANGVTCNMMESAENSRRPLISELKSPHRLRSTSRK